MKRGIKKDFKALFAIMACGLMGLSKSYGYSQFDGSMGVIWM